jgi:glycosyltransferase involved in cell wall biosynthesis
MRIAVLATQFTPPHFLGGHEHALYHLDRQFAELGCEVDVYTPTFPRWADIDAASTARNVTRIPVRDVRFLYNLEFARKLAASLKRRDYDVVLNTHAPLGRGLALRPHVVRVASTSLGEARHTRGLSPAVLLERLFQRTLGFAVERRVLRLCDHAVCNSEHIRDEVVKGYGIAREKTTVIGNGVDGEYYRPGPARHAGVLRILFVGRLVDIKQLPLLLRAAAALRRETSAFEVRIVGEGPDDADLRKLAHRLGVDPQVGFTGHKSKAAVLEEYQKADAFVLTSRHEGMPNALLEALACGLPAVVNRFAGAEALVRDGANGFVLSEASPEELASKLLMLLRDPALRQRLGAEARRRAIEQFSWERVAKAYLALFEALRR